jgi:hypothetical protein
MPLKHARHPGFLLSLLVGTALAHAAPQKPTEAGKGDHQVYLVQGPGRTVEATPSKEAEKHTQYYLAVQAQRWYVNRQGNALRDRMASGTVNLKLNEEEYRVALGNYQLEGGARTAPVFGSTVLYNRVYGGGNLEIKVFVKAVQNNTTLGSLLQSIAASSIAVGKGVVGSFTATGPSAVMVAASRDLVAGVEQALNTSQDALTLLDPNGVSITLNPKELHGKEVFVLFHRGAALLRDSLAIKLYPESRSLVSDVLYDGKPLEDGAWVLFRVSLEETYGAPRPWDKVAQQLINQTMDLIEDVAQKITTSENAKKLLTPTGGAQPVLGDRLQSLLNDIRGDYVLTREEASLEAARIRSMWNDSRTALTTGRLADYLKRFKNGTYSLDSHFRTEDFGVLAATEADAITRLHFVSAGTNVQDTIKFDIRQFMRTIQTIDTYKQNEKLAVDPRILEEQRKIRRTTG